MLHVIVRLGANDNVDEWFDDIEKPLFPGCEEFLVLSFLLNLIHVKVTSK